MALAYLLDEHLRGPLWWAIQRRNARGIDIIDAVRVGDHDAPQLGTSDPELLIWAEQAGRILITLDENTMPDHFTEHLRTGRHSPGIFTIRPSSNWQDVGAFLALAAFPSEQKEWEDRIAYIP